MDKYYQAPSDKIFEEIKKGAIKVWKTYDDTYDYATGKINRIKDITNISDNAMFMVAIFDNSNRRKLLGNLSKEAQDFIMERIN